MEYIDPLWDINAPLILPSLCQAVACHVLDCWAIICNNAATLDVRPLSIICNNAGTFDLKPLTHYL